MSKVLKERAAFFSSAEQELLIRLYEEYKDIITKKGNTSCINKAREAAWQNIADKLNASNMGGVKRTWQQVKVKYKNILQNATRKKTATAATGGGPPVAARTPAEDLALEQNSRRPIIVGIEGGTSSDPDCLHDTQPYVKVVGGVLTLLDPPVFDDDEMEEQREEKPSTSRAYTSAREQESKIREIYKRYLLQEIECKKADLQYKKLKIRKLELEIKKMEKDAQQDNE